MTQEGNPPMLVVEDGRQVSAGFHPSPFIKDGLRPVIPNDGFHSADRM